MKALHKHRLFKHARKVAVETLRNPEKLRQLLASAMQLTTKEGRNAKVQALNEKAQPLIRFARAYLNREYTTIPWRTLILVVAALIYFVNPFDAIFDALPLVGFIDDAAVLTAVLSSIKHDLAKFLEWERSTKEPQTMVIDAEFEEVKNG